MPAYPSPKAGEWIQPVRRGYRMACCDCGLVHTMNFRVVKGPRGGLRAQFQADRHNKATWSRRKRHGITVRTKE